MYFIVKPYQAMNLAELEEFAQVTIYDSEEGDRLADNAGRF